MKKFLAILLAMILVLSLAACAAKDSGNDGQQSQTTDTTDEKKDDASTDSTKTDDASDIKDFNGDGKITIACVHRNLLGASGVNFRAAYYYEADQEGAEIMFFDGNQDVQAQCDYMEDCMAAKSCDAFIVWTCDADGIAGTVQAAHDEGYPVIVVDIALNCDQDAFVAAGNKEMGVMAGESAVEYLTKKNGSEKGNVYVITATTQSTARDRVEGFLSVIDQYPEITVVDTYDMPTSSVDDGVALADDLIQKNLDGTVDVYFCMNMSPMLGLISAAATYNRTDFVLVGGFDYNDTFVEEIQKGEGNTVLWSFTAQDYFEIGTEAFKLAAQAAVGTMPAEKNVAVPGEIVSYDNLDAYLTQYNEYQNIITQYQ